MDRSDDQSLTWFRLSIFGELGLNHSSSTAARDKRKVSSPSLSHILLQCRLVTVVFVCRGKQQPIDRGKSSAKGRPATNESRKRKPEGSIRRRAGRFPRAAIASLASSAASLQLCIHPLGAVHPGATAIHTAPREFSENAQHLLPPIEPPKIGLLSQRVVLLETPNISRSNPDHDCTERFRRSVVL